MNKILSEKGEVTTNTAEIQSIKNYYKQLYTNRPSQEMDKFLERHNIPVLNQEETEDNHNKWNWISNFKLLSNKIPGSDSLTVWLYQTFKEELVPILKLSPNI